MATRPSLLLSLLGILAANTAWGQVCTGLSCQKQCGPPSDVGIKQYNACVANCEADCKAQACGNLPRPFNVCATYTCGSNEKWVVSSYHPGVACTIGAKSGVCNNTGSCIAKPNGSTPLQSGDILTYHYDSLRTGWNQSETVLNAASVANNAGSASSNCGAAGANCFGLLYPPTPLDEQVDAEPLFVRGLSVTTASGTAAYDVIFAATENDTVYAIDSASGKILLNRTLNTGIGGVSIGGAVPQSKLPDGAYSLTSSGQLGPCTNNSNFIGIDSTPVIDLSTNTLYVITYNQNPINGQTYYFHALDLRTLAEKGNSPQVISASGLLRDHVTQFKFNAAYQRQRPALLESQGNVYAAFGSFCDYGDQSRGWVMGWNAANFAALSAVNLTDHLLPGDLSGCDAGNAGSGISCFLSSVWMSGSGLATDSSGNIFFMTGNSDQPNYPPTNNLQESLVEVSADLSTTKGFFTPAEVQVLDESDGDFGSGGVLLLPDQSGSLPHLAVAAGKAIGLYLLNRDNLPGQWSYPGSSNLGPAYPIGNCWCNESFFIGPDNIPRVVGSGGGTIMSSATSASAGGSSPDFLSIWQVRQGGASAWLELDPPGYLLPGDPAHDPGFFTSVSSNGTQNGSAVIWAVQRPTGQTDPYLTLLAYDARDGSQLPQGAPQLLFAGPAGTWPNPASNPNVVPAVGNGKVFVASYKQLAIFGLGANGQAAILNPQGFNPQPNVHRIYGIIQKITASQIQLKLRTGKIVTADLTIAVQHHRSAAVAVGSSLAILAVGDPASGVVKASRTYRVPNRPGDWPHDQ